MKRLLLSFVACLLFGLAQAQPGTATVYPYSVPLATGTTDGSIFTDSSEVRAVALSEAGWMSFDVSSIPADAVITSIEFNGYVNQYNYPYWAITPVSLNPLTTSASDLFDEIEGSVSVDEYNYIDYELTSTFPGPVTFVLGGASNADLQAAMASDTFSIGFYEDDVFGTYHIHFDGWDETNVPYLVVNYFIPYNNDVSIVLVEDLFDCGAGPDSLSVTVHNIGELSQSNVPVMYSIDGGAFQLGATYTGTVLPNDSFEVKFPVTVALGAHDIALATNLSGDEDTGNDSLSTTAMKGTGEITVEIYEGSYGSEISWALIDVTSGAIVDSIPMGTYADFNYATYSYTYCVEYGNNFAFRTYDEFGDSWNGATYTITGGCLGDIVANNGGNSPTDGNGSGPNLETEEFFTVNCPANEVGVESIWPMMACGAGTGSLKFSLKNFGSATHNSIPVLYSVNGGSFVSGVVTTDALALGEVDTFLLPVTFPAGVSDIVIVTNLTGDTVFLNDTAATTINVLNVVSAFPYYESFEADSGGWIVSGTTTTWELGEPDNSIINAASDGLRAWVTNLDGVYTADENGAVVSPCFDLSSLSKPTLYSDIWYDIETGWDGANMQYSTDSGLTWHLLGDMGTGMNWYNDTTLEGLPGGDTVGWTGAGADGSNGWLATVQPLNLPSSGNVIFRVNFGSDTYTVNEGFAFDGFSIRNAPAVDVALNDVQAGEMCNVGMYDVDVTLVQKGNDTIYGFALTVSSNGGAFAAPVNVPDTLYPYMPITVTIPANMNLPGVANELTITHTLVGDGDTGNDTVTVGGFVTDPSGNYLEDFEADNFGFWEAAPTSGYAWFTNSGSTSSSSTGPDFDHTLGTASGVYVYTEATNSGTEAILESPCIDPALANPAISFWYHMYGSTIDTLWVEQTLDGTSWTSVGYLEGQHQTSTTDAWKMKSYLLSTGVKNVRFRIKKGTSYLGDVALDDIQIFEAPSVDIAQTVATPRITCAADSMESSFVNLGVTPVSNVTISYSVDGGAFVQAGSFSGTLNFGESSSLVLPITVPDGNHTIAVVASVAGDVLPGNDTITTTVFNPFPLSGTYSLGGTTADFANFGQLIAALDCGITGPSTVNVVSGTGPFNEQVIFADISGLSAVNTLTINGNGEAIEFSNSSSDRRIVGIEGLSYITLDSLIVRSLSSSYGYGIHLLDSAEHISITNCVIDLSSITSTTSSNSGGIVASGSISSQTTSASPAASSLLIENNTVKGDASGSPYYGIVLYGGSSSFGSDNIVRNNIVSNVYYYGIRANYQNNIEISGNDISSKDRTNVGTFNGIYLSGGNQSANVFGNYIHHPNSGDPGATAYGIYSSSDDAGSGTENNFYNNVIANFEGTGTLYGIYNSGSDSANYVHNTISLDFQGSTSGTTYGFYQTTSATGINFVNNIVSVTRAGTGTRAAVRFNTTSSAIVSDYNVLFIDTSNDDIETGYYGSTPFTTLADWQAANSGAYGANSAADNPYFAGASDFTPLSTAIDNMGLAVGVTDDFYGAVRSATTPDVGAIEFTGIPGDLAILEASMSRESLCYGSSDTVRVSFYNYFGPTVDFSVDTLLVHWSVSGPVTSSGTLPVNAGTLAEGDTMYLEGTGVDMSQPGTYTLTAYLGTNAVNVNAANDTLADVLELTVDPILSVSPALTVLTNPMDSAVVTAQSPLYVSGADIFITESCHYRGHSSPDGGWPSYLIADDYLELTGPAGLDIQGYTLEEWNSSSLQHSATFPAGTVFSPDGTMILAIGQLGSSAPSPADYYYHSGNTITHSSTTSMGYVIKDASGAIVDAYAHGSITFPAASGVTALDWSGSTPSSSSAGNRLTGPDMNDGTGWIVTTTGNHQDPNVLNSGVTAPPQPIPPAGFEWTLLGVTHDTWTSTIVGPYAISGDTLVFVANYNSACGIYTDSVMVVTDYLETEINATDVTCAGDANGSVTVTASGGQPPYSYEWSNGATTASLSGLSGGTYTVTVKDADDWADTLSIVVNESDSMLTASLATVPSSCGVPNGEVHATVTGGTAPYSFAWSNGSTDSASIDSLTSGAYSVTITDVYGCSVIKNINVNDAGAPALTLTVSTPLNCYGDTNAVVTLNAVGGTPPYAYAWSTGVTDTNVLVGLSIGTYAVSVTDSADCLIAEEITVTQPAQLMVNTSTATEPLCNGQSNGSIVLDAQGGTGTLTYTWDNGMSGDSISGLATGTYAVTIADANGCELAHSQFVDQPAVLTVSLGNQDNVSCNGADDGEATFTVTGGTTPYTYAWSNGDATATADSLAPGTHSVTVTDANGCSAIHWVNITEPTALASAVDGVVDVLCYGDATGSINISVSGGANPYSFNWDNGSTTEDLNGVAAGSYNVTITDNNGCTSTETATIAEPGAALAATGTVTDVTCNDSDDGAVDLTTTGGTAPYSWIWPGGITTEDATGLSGGNQTVIVIDDNNCISNFTFTVNEPAALVATFDSEVDATCIGGNDGEVQVTTTGGTTPYSFAWSNGATTEDITGLVEDSYTLVVTDDNGCTYTDEATIGYTNELPVVNITSNNGDTLCEGEVTTLSATSGMTVYQWSDGSSNADLDVTATGTFDVTVTDANGCVNSSDSFDVYVSPAVALAVTGTDVTCEGGSDGVAMAAFSGGTLPYSYEWGNAGTDTNITELSAGTYTVTATDAAGCSLTDSITLTYINATPVVDLGPDLTLGTGAVIEMDAGTGAGYEWSTGDNTQTITYIAGVEGDTIWVTVTSDAGCIGSDTVVIDINLGVDNKGVATSFKLYPNPNRGMFTLASGSYSGEVKVGVLDITGKLVHFEEYTATVGAEQKVQISQLAAGTYSVRIETAQGVNTVRMIVQ